MKNKLGLLAIIILALSAKTAVAVESMADYNDVPTTISTSVTPNILIIMDNSGSMNDQAYKPPDYNFPPTTAGDTYDPAITYYGYFGNRVNGVECYYNYSSNIFNLAGPPGTVGTFSGNFLNWATMRKIDIGREVLVGGKATSRTGGGNANLVGDTGSGWWVWKYGTTGAIPAPAYTPFTNASGTKITYELSGGYLYVVQYGTGDDPNTVNGSTLGQYTIKVHKDSTNACDAGAFINGNIGGLIQQVGNQGRFGIEFFNSGCGASEGCGGGGSDGGTVSQSITGVGYGTNFIPAIENTAANTWTPLAEALYTAAGYFSQNQLSSYFLSNGSMRYNNNDYNIGIGTQKDPLYFSELSSFVPCAKNFVIMITDGMPTMDSNIPAAIMDFDHSGLDPVNDPRYTDGPYGTDFLDDVALWAHTTDLRPDLTGTQTLTIYTVFVAFGGTSPTDPARNLLINTAKNGGFTDSNGNGLPDSQSEWGGMGRTYAGVVVPDTYYEAYDGAMLESSLQAAITDILKRASSGTAVSVLATSATGAGTMFQAFYLPSKTVVDSGGSRTLTWLGYLMSLSIDSTGAIRDNAGNCINFSFDVATNQTMVNTLSANASNVCTTTVTATTPLTTFTEITAPKYNWEGGHQLLLNTPPAELAIPYTPPLMSSPIPLPPLALPNGRYIFTFIPHDSTGVAASGGLDQVRFIASNGCSSVLSPQNLQPYLRAAACPSPEAANIISWIQGNSVTGYRDRTLNATFPTQQWKLGDIVYSTPTTVGPPLESFNLLYKDTTYASYYSAYKNRAEMVFVGANDGMLHAFDSVTGGEIWAYIPFNLLPHLKWLTSSSYNHVDYVDLKVKITDVYTGTSPIWKTILIGGMRFGGGETCHTAGDCGGISPFRSSYFAIDITNPSAPVVLWELNGANLGLGANAMGFAMSYPSIVKVGDNFFAVFGSGTKDSYVPDYKGATFQAGQLIVVNIATGRLAASFTAPDAQSYFANPIAVDIDLSTTNRVDGISGNATGGATGTYNTEVVYVGETYQSGGVWGSRMWRLVTNNDTNPVNWKFGILFNTSSSGQPMTGAPASSSDPQGNVWLFFGTGKLFSNTDKTDTYTQSVFGVKDPCWNATTQTWNSTCLSASALAPSVTITGLVNVTGTNVYTTGVVSGGTTGQTSFTGLQALVQSKSGWYFDLTASTTSYTEKFLNKPTVFGGLVLFTTFIPNNDVCGMGGNSYTYAVFYLTGTAYPNPGAFGYDTGTNLVYQRTQTAYVGMASSITIHSGREAGVTAFVQLSTGQTLTIAATPSIQAKSGIISWREL